MKKRLIVCVFTGMLAAIIVVPLMYFIAPELTEAGLCGCVLFGVLLYGFLWVYDRVLQGRYAAVEKQLPSPVWMQASGNYQTKPRQKSANLYFCEDCVIIACLEEKPYTMDVIPKERIARYESEDCIHLKIVTESGTEFAFTSGDTPSILEGLKEKRWM